MTLLSINGLLLPPSKNFPKVDTSRYSIDNKWVTVMDGIKFEFNDTITLYTKITVSGDGLSV